MSKRNWGVPAATLAAIRVILSDDPKVQKAILFDSRILVE